MNAPLIAAFASTAEFLQAYDGQLAAGALRLGGVDRDFGLFEECEVLLRVPGEPEVRLLGWVSDVARGVGVTVLLPSLPAAVTEMAGRLRPAVAAPRTRAPAASTTLLGRGPAAPVRAVTAPRVDLILDENAPLELEGLGSGAVSPISPISANSAGPASPPRAIPRDRGVEVRAEPTDAVDEDPGQAAALRIPANVFAALDALSPTQKLQRALQSAVRDERLALLRDNNKLLHVYVLKNPRITLDEVQAAAKMSTLAPDALKFIYEHVEWGKNSTVCTALVRNPRMPLDLAVRLVDRIAMSEVRALAKGTGRPAIVQAARKRLAV